MINTGLNLVCLLAISTTCTNFWLSIAFLQNIILIIFFCIVSIWKSHKTPVLKYQKRSSFHSEFKTLTNYEWSRFLLWVGHRVVVLTSNINVEHSNMILSKLISESNAREILNFRISYVAPKTPKLYVLTTFVIHPILITDENSK